MLLKALLSVLSFCYFRRSLKMELASLNQLTVGEVEDKISAEKSALARTQKKRLDFFIPPPPGGSRQTIFFLFVQITPLGTVVP